MQGTTTQDLTQRYLYFNLAQNMIYVPREFYRGNMLCDVYDSKTGSLDCSETMTPENFFAEGRVIVAQEDIRQISETSELAKVLSSRKNTLFP